VKNPDKSLSMISVTRKILVIAGLYALVAALLLLYQYANHYGGQSFGEILLTSWFVPTIAALPYALFGLSSWLARVRWKQITLFTVVIVSACSSLIVYVGAFLPGGPAETYGTLFLLLGGLQTMVAVILIIISL
jgi:hypothetical protein